MKKHVPVAVVIVAMLVPFALTIAGVVVMLSWLQELPTTVVTHWGLDGPDGFGAPISYPILFAIVGVVAVAALGSTVVFAAGKSELTRVLKALAVTPLWLVVFIGVISVWSLGTQRGLADAAAAPDLTPAIVVAVVASLLFVVIGWFVMPPADKPVRGGTSNAGTMPIAAGERVLWTGLASTSTSLIVIIGGVSLFAAAAVALAIVRSGGRYWALAFIPIVVVLLVISTFAWRVRVDSRGVEVRSVLGVPRFFISVDHIESASVATINPIGDFGGWGLRWGLNKRFGVVLHRGEALEVHRTDGHSLVVTIDHPGDAAALVNGLVARAKKSAGNVI